MIANGRLLARNWRLLTELRETTAKLQRARAEAMPPHACGPVIMPGESCEMTVILGLTLGGEDTTY